MIGERKRVVDVVRKRKEKEQPSATSAHALFITIIKKRKKSFLSPMEKKNPTIDDALCGRQVLENGVKMLVVARGSDEKLIAKRDEEEEKKRR